MNKVDFDEGSLGLGVDPIDESGIGAFVSSVSADGQGSQKGVKVGWVLVGVATKDVSKMHIDKIMEVIASSDRPMTITFNPPELPEFLKKDRQENDFDVYFKTGDVGLSFILDRQLVVSDVKTNGQAWLSGLVEKGNLLIAVDNKDINSLSVEDVLKLISQRKTPGPFLFRPTAVQIKEREDKRKQNKALAERKVSGKSTEESLDDIKENFEREREKSRRKDELEYQKREKAKKEAEEQNKARFEERLAKRMAAKKKRDDSHYRQLMAEIKEKQNAVLMNGFQEGKRVEVWWPNMKNTFPGKVVSVDEDGDLTIEYDHGPSKTYTHSHLETLIKQGIEHEHMLREKRRKRKQLRSDAADEGFKLNKDYELFDPEHRHTQNCKILRVGDDAEGLVVQYTDGTVVEYTLDEMIDRRDQALEYAEEEKRTKKRCKKLGYTIGSDVTFWSEALSKSIKGTVRQYFHSHVQILLEGEQLDSFEVEDFHQKVLKSKEMAALEGDLAAIAEKSGIMTGAKINIWWPSANNVYTGVVVGFAGFKIHVKYEDGDERLYELEELLDRMEAAIVESERLKKEQVELAKKKREALIARKREIERKKRIAKIEAQKRRKEELRLEKIREEEEQERLLLEAIAAEEAERARQAELERLQREAEEAEIRRIKHLRGERIQYNNPTTTVKEMSIQTEILPPSGKVKTPMRTLRIDDVIGWHKDGLELMHKAYRSKVGLNKIGLENPTFDQISKHRETVGKEEFLQLASDFRFCSIKNRRVDGRGAKLISSNQAWYKLWSEIPLEYPDIIQNNLAEISKLGTAIGLGNAVFASSAMSQIEYASEDPRIPPKLSFEGSLPILKDEAISIFNKASGKENAFRHLNLKGFHDSLVAIAFKGVRRSCPTSSFVRSCFKSSPSRAAFYAAVVSPGYYKPFRFAFCHWTRYPKIWNWVTQNRQQCQGRQFMSTYSGDQRVLAAIVIQAALRGPIFRSIWRRKYYAATHIQSICRGKLQRLRFRRALALRRAKAEMVAVNRIIALRPAQCLMAILERASVSSLNQLKRNLMGNNRGFVYGEMTNSQTQWTDDQLDKDFFGDTQRGTKIDMGILFAGPSSGPSVPAVGSSHDASEGFDVKDSVVVNNLESRAVDKIDGNWLDSMGIHGPPEENDKVLAEMKVHAHEVHDKLEQKHKNHDFSGHGFNGQEIGKGDISAITWGDLEKQDEEEKQRRRRKVRQPFVRDGDGLGREDHLFTPGNIPATPPQVSWEQIQSVDMNEIDNAYNQSFLKSKSKRGIKKSQTKSSPVASSRKLRVSQTTKTMTAAPKRPPNRRK